MQLDKEALFELLKEDEKKKSVSYLEDFHIEPFVASGDAHASSLKRVCCRVVLKNGKRVDTSFFLKEIPKSGLHAGFIHKHHFFEREILLFKEILPLMEDVLREHNIPPLWGRLIGLKPDHLLFSDLKVKNYKVGDRIGRLDMTQSLLVINSLAIFHAASLVLKHRGLLDLSKFKPFLFSMNTPEIKKTQELGLFHLSDIMIQEWGPEWIDIGQRVRKKALILNAELLKLCKTDERRFNVLNHGDPWAANIMFKYSKATDGPIGVRFVDFQMAHYNSYGFDLIYFINTAVRKAIRREDQRALLQSYTRVLEESLQLYGLGDLALSLSAVEAEMERLETFRFFILTTFTAFLCTEVKNACNLEGFTEGRFDGYNPDIYRGTFKNEIDQELRQWADEGFI